MSATDHAVQDLTSTDMLQDDLLAEVSGGTVRGTIPLSQIFNLFGYLQRA